MDDINTDKNSNSLDSHPSEKNLQPSESFLNELRFAEPSPGLETEAANPTMPSMSSVVVPGNNSQSSPAPTSIYPELKDIEDPTKIEAQNNSTVPEGGTKSRQEKIQATSRVLGIKLIGVFMILISIFSLYTYFHYRIAIHGSFYGIGYAVFGFLLGIGIFFKIEMARKFYIFLALLTLLYSIYGTYTYLRQPNITKSFDTAKANAQLQQDIANIQNSTFYSTADKQGFIQQAKDSANNRIQLQQRNTGYRNIVINLVESYSFAIIPLIFLTRKSVKEEFS